MAANMPDKPVTSAWTTVKPFFNGGLSGMMATCIIQPIDMVKVRLQLGASGSPIKVASDIVKNDGIGGLYKGLSAGLLRQATYTTARLGIFKIINEEAIKRNEGKKLPIYTKLLCGLTAGGMGALVGTPADLTLIRMQADSTLPPEQRRNYKGIGDAFMRTVKDDGVAGLFRGAGPTIARAMALNMGMFASNEQAKELLAESTPMTGLPLTASASMIAGFFAAACSLPFDFVKTRLQKMTADANGKYPYSGFIDCGLKTLAQEGPLRFYTGFPTYVVRIGPHVVFTLIFADMLPKWEKSIGL